VGIYDSAAGQNRARFRTEPELSRVKPGLFPTSCGDEMHEQIAPDSTQGVGRYWFNQ
jgi:hypothetical protein